MATTKAKDVRFSDEDVMKILALTKDADSVELELTVPATEFFSKELSPSPAG